MAAPTPKLQAMKDGELVMLALSILLADVSHREALGAAGDQAKLLGAQRIGTLAMECRRRSGVA